MEKYQPAEVRILVVEDHGMMKKMLLDLLRSHGFETIHAATKARDAISILRRNPVDFVLLDLYLAEGHGLEVLEHVRSQQTRYDIPVLIISGEASKDDIVRAVELGSTDYLVKPFQTSDLEKKIESILGSFFSPGDILRHVRGAESLLHDGELDSAHAKIKEAIAAEPENTRANYLHGIIVDAIGDTECAIGILMNNRQRNPKYLRNYSALADMFIKQRRPKLAITALQQELKINPKEADRQVILADLLRESGDFNTAIDHYRKALVEDSTLQNALLGMGDCFTGLENTEKALYYYRRLRKNYPDLAVPLDRIVELGLAFEVPKLAENYLKTEIKSQPSRSDLYLGLSKLYCRMGDRQGAEHVVARAREKFPDNTIVWEMAAYIHLQFNEVNKALSIYEKVFQLTKSAHVSLELAKLYQRTKKYDHALRYLQRYTAMTGDFSPEVISRLFYLCAYNRQWVKADLLAKRYEKEQQLSGEMKKLVQAVQKNLGKRRTAKPARMAS